MSTLDHVSTPNDEHLKAVAIRANTVRDVEAEIQKEATMSRAQFHRAIKEAHQAGHSYRAIAEAAGISHQRVAQLLKKGEQT